MPSTPENPDHGPTHTPFLVQPRGQRRDEPCPAGTRPKEEGLRLRYAEGRRREPQAHERGKTRGDPRHPQQLPPHPAFEPRQGDNVQGEVYEVDQETLSEVDQYEGPEFQRRRVRLEDGTIAYVYVPLK